MLAAEPAERHVAFRARIIFTKHKRLPSRKTKTEWKLRTSTENNAAHPPKSEVSARRPLPRLYLFSVKPCNTNTVSFFYCRHVSITFNRLVDLLVCKLGETSAVHVQGLIVRRVPLTSEPWSCQRLVSFQNNMNEHM